MLALARTPGEDSYTRAANDDRINGGPGTRTKYSYDALNRVTQVAYGEQTILYSYDAGTNGKGRLTVASDSAHILAWSYDSLGRVTAKTQTTFAVPLSVGYAYTSGDLTTLTTPSGQAVVYTYSNHRVTSVKVNGTTVLSGVAYEPFGPARTWTWGSGQAESRLHDTDGNPSNIAGPEQLSYSLDNAFRITGITNATTPAASWTYGYNPMDRLTSATGSSALSWTYDAVGNRQTQVGGAAPTYPSATATLTYNNRGRLTTAINTITETYAYNALGQRNSKSGAGVSTVFMYDEAGHLLGEYNSSGTMIQETIWLEDLPIATLRPHSGGGIDTYYVHPDHLGSPRLVTRSTDNAVVWRWDSDPFGTNQPNQNPGGLGAFSYNLRFPGQYYDAESGLNYNYFRDYDGQTGRYVESDPMDQRTHAAAFLTALNTGTDVPPLELNSYAYVSESPLQRIDPFGLDTLMCTKFWHPHTFLCVDGTCSGKYPSGNPIASPGVIRNDSKNQGSATCSVVPNKCPGTSFDDCVKKRLLQRGPSGDLYSFSGANCGGWAEDVVSSCRRQCTNSK